MLGLLYKKTQKMTFKQYCDYRIGCEVRNCDLIFPDYIVCRRKLLYDLLESKQKALELDKTNQQNRLRSERIDLLRKIEGEENNEG